jgi:hypothetical protein
MSQGRRSGRTGTRKYTVEHVQWAPGAGGQGQGGAGPGLPNNDDPLFPAVRAARGPTTPCPDRPPPPPPSARAWSPHLTSMRQGRLEGSEGRGSATLGAHTTPPRGTKRHCGRVGHTAAQPRHGPHPSHLVPTRGPAPASHNGSPRPLGKVMSLVGIGDPIESNGARLGLGGAQPAALEHVVVAQSPGFNKPFVARPRGRPEASRGYLKRHPLSLHSTACARGNGSGRVIEPDHADTAVHCKESAPPSPPPQKKSFESATSRWPPTPTASKLGYNSTLPPPPPRTRARCNKALMQDPGRIIRGQGQESKCAGTGNRSTTRRIEKMRCV